MRASVWFSSARGPCLPQHAAVPEPCFQFGGVPSRAKERIICCMCACGEEQQQLLQHPPRHCGSVVWELRQQGRLYGSFRGPWW
eukprot:gene11482-biopygen7859